MTLDEFIEREWLDYESNFENGYDYETWIDIHQERLEEIYIENYEDFNNDN